MDLMAEAHDAAPDRPVLPLVVRRLRLRWPGDAAARRELAEILGVGEELAAAELRRVLPPHWLDAADEPGPHA
jgi:hypothetical protein